MNNSLVLPLAMLGQLLVSPAAAQGPDREVTILRMSGPQLGVRLVEVDKDAVTRLKLKEEKGALVTEVIKDSAAEKAGIKEDDVILRFQGESVLTAAQLSRLVKDVPPGRKVDLDLVRDGAPLKVTATIENAEWSSGGMERPELADLNKRLRQGMERHGPAGMPLGRSGRGRLGVAYSEIGGQLARYFKAPSETAVLVDSVVEGSPAEKAGIRAGDLLIKVGGTSVKDGGDLQDAVRGLEGGKSTTLTVWREGKGVDLSVTPDEDSKAKPPAPGRRRPVS